MKKKYYLLLIIFIMAALSAACQPTPDEPAVVGKNDDLEEKIQQTAPPDSLEQQAGQYEIWQETLKFNAGSVLIDAAVVRPDVSAIPVLDVVPHEFTPEEAQRLVDLFMQGQPIYEYQNAFTKEDCTEEILKMQAELQEAESGGGEYKTEAARLSAISMLKDSIEYLEELYEQAPAAKAGLTPATVEFKEAEDPLSEYTRGMSIQADLGKDEPAWLTISMTDDNYDNTVWFNNGEQRNAPYTELDATETLSGQNITLKAAQAEAESLLRDIGIEAVQLSSSKVLVDVTDIADKANYPSALSDPDREKFYVLCYAPVYYGVPVTNVPSCSGMLSDDTATFNFIWIREQIEIKMDDSGIVRFVWTSPGEVTGVVNSNVQLIDFKTIKERFRDQIAYEKEWNAPGSRFKITINKIQLGYMRVRVKDKDAHRLLPVWDFIGDWDTGSQVESGTSFMTINAIDGSVIDTELGY